MHISTLTLWLPLIAVGLHIFEEFVFPGGFADWYRQYDPPAAASITPRFLVIANVILIVLCLVPPLIGATVRGMGYWLIASAVCAGNALWHCYAVWNKRRYSPGVVTGVLVYLPLAIYGVLAFVLTGFLSPFVVGEAALIGAGYAYWSIRRRRTKGAMGAP